jgi:exosome complex component RRP43
MSAAETETNVQLKATIFSPSELALIAPDVTLSKYLKAGYRPSLRRFNEFKPIVISTAGISRYDTAAESGRAEDVNESTTVIGSASVKCGGTSTICMISAGIVEDDFEAVNDYRMRLDADIIVEDEEEEVENVFGGDLINVNGSVYPVIEIARGSNAPPGDEEIELGERLYESVLHSGLIRRDDLRVDVGLKSIDENRNEVILKGDDVGNIKKKFSFVLYARIQVFGRTGPLFDQCYASLVKALKDTKLPDVYLNERESSMRTRAGKRNANINIQSYDLVCDPIKHRNLNLREERICWASTFGIADIEEIVDAEGDSEMQEGEQEVVRKSLILTDLEGDAEDNIMKRITALSNGKGQFVSVTIEQDARGTRLTKDVITKALKLAQVRAKDMIEKL